MSITRSHSEFLPRGATTALVATGLLLAGCSGPLDAGLSRSETRSVGDFHSIELRGAANANVRVGPAISVSVTAGENTLQHLTTRVDNDTLIVEQKRRWFWGGDEVQVDVTMPALREIVMGGAGNINVQDMQGESLRLSLQGAGNVVAVGETGSLKVTINGAGNANLLGLRSRSASVTVNGTGNVTVNASEALDAVVNGVGSVRYVGSPPKLDTKVNGVGNVGRIDTDLQPEAS